MPAIHPRYLNCVVYLFPNTEDAERGRAVGGSGFVVEVGDPSYPGIGLHYVVTNRHVVETGNMVVRLNSIDQDVCGLNSLIEHWRVSEEDDLAILPFSWPANANRECVSADDFIDEDAMIEGWKLCPGDEAFFFGRFVTHEGFAQNKPVVRFGNISMLPDPEAPVRVGVIDQLAFLVECRSISGFSGSPAFVKLSGTRLLTAEAPSGWIPVSLKFLGVDCAHLPFWAPVRRRTDGSKDSDLVVETNSAMAVIIPAWRLRSLLNRPDVREHRLECLARTPRTETATSTLGQTDGADEPRQPSGVRYSRALDTRPSETFEGDPSAKPGTLEEAASSSATIPAEQTHLR